MPMPSESTGLPLIESCRCSVTCLNPWTGLVRCLAWQVAAPVATPLCDHSEMDAGHGMDPGKTVVSTPLTGAFAVALQARVCNLTDVREACSLQRDASSRDRQFLFSFYSHTRPNYTGHAADSVLHHRIVPGLLEVRCPAPRPHGSRTEAARTLGAQQFSRRTIVLEDRLRHA